jgi:hypothetical protein
MFIEVNQIHNFMSSSGSGTVINYGSGSSSDFLTTYGSGSTTLITALCIMGGGGSREPRTAIEVSFSVWGVSENLIAGSAAARLFFMTAIAIAIATRPFKYHENLVANTSSSFVSSIHSLAFNAPLLQLT